MKIIYNLPTLVFLFVFTSLSAQDWVLKMDAYLVNQAAAHATVAATINTPAANMVDWNAEFISALTAVNGRLANVMGPQFSTAPIDPAADPCCSGAGWWSNTGMVTVAIKLGEDNVTTGANAGFVAFMQSLPAGFANNTFTQQPGSNIFHVVVNTSHPDYANLGTANAMHVQSMLEHEISHGVGLDHVAGPNELMMAALPDNTPIPIDQDEEDGFNCIYNGIGARCPNNVAASSEYYITSQLQNNDLLIDWDIEAESNAIIGFNIYKKEARSFEYESINNEFIVYDLEQSEYDFVIEDFDGQAEYYLEIIRTGQRTAPIMEKITPYQTVRSDD